MKDAPSDEDHSNQHQENLKTFETRLDSLIRGYDWNFETYDDENLKSLLVSVWRWVRQTIKAGMMKGESPYWLTIMGPSEVGKTHLAQRALASVKDITTSGALKLPRLGFTEGQMIPLESDFMSAPRITEVAKNTFGFTYGFGQNFALGVDDVGARGADTEFAQRTIYQILEGRSESGQLPTKATLITTNLDWEEFNKTQDPRLSSRLRRGENVIHEVPNTTIPFLDRTPTK